MSQNGWLDMKRLAALSSTARDNLAGPLGDLGRQWAKSPDRPRPEQSVLRRWEHVLDDWIADPSLPLVIRGSGRRGERATCSNGREVVFSDNSPANWSFGLALAGQVPDIRSWTSSSLPDRVPLTFLTKGPAGKRDLNKSGWKICHIEPVSDRKRDPHRGFPDRSAGGRVPQTSVAGEHVSGPQGDIGCRRTAGTDRGRGCIRKIGWKVCNRRLTAGAIWRVQPACRPLWRIQRHRIQSPK